MAYAAGHRSGGPTRTFVSPRHVDQVVLERARQWFAQAGDCDQPTAPFDLELDPRESLPFTRKSDMRRRLRPYPETGRWIASLCSSGTTAEPVVSPWSEADELVADATMRAIHRFCPSLDGAQCAVIAPSHALAAAYFMCRQIEVNGGTPHLITSTDPETVARALVDEGIEAVFSLPLVVSRIGEYFRMTRGAPPSKIRLIICGGDVLSAARQAMLTQMWDALVLNMFGCSELFGPVAGPGAQDGLLFWRCERVAVEVLDPVTLTHCGPGERGVVVLSTLWPKASPLLRYWTDDVVQIIDGSSATATFVFEYIGRPSSMLDVAYKKVPLRDIDGALLSGGWCTSEWSIQQAPDQIRIEVETTMRQDVVLSGMREVLHELVGGPVELVPREPGSLPRTLPKFAVLRHGSRW
jgi:phenylacetate-coenzyme A ligase PaaK-like adenylate-forming protein